MPVGIQRDERQSFTVLSITGDLDIVGAPELRKAVIQAVADGVRRLILDLSDLDFVDSVGLGVVVGALKRLRQRDGDLAVVCPVARIRRVFEICDLDRVLTMHTSIDHVIWPDTNVPPGTRGTSATGHMPGARGTSATGHMPGTRGTDATGHMPGTRGTGASASAAPREAKAEVSWLRTP